jgi:predicted homoserine dehydrogenase-like protein
MCVCFTDGTKLNIEMALVANCEGYVTRKKGMFGPQVKDVRDVFSCFDFKKLWEDRIPFVDYILGAEPGGGVYVIGYCEDSFQKGVLRYYKMGEGPFYLFYRPYHLGHLESVRTILDVTLEKKALMQPRPVMMTNVFAYAKNDLKAGDLLDGMGGYACYGLIENMTDQKDGEGLPVCLADGVCVKKAVKKDEKVLLENVEYDPARPDYAVYYKWILRS